MPSLPVAGIVAFMPRDLGTWGFILSLLALLLMYPVGILINITSPKVANWWSTRSKNSVIERITRLQCELAQLEKTPAFSEYEFHVLRAIGAMFAGLVFVCGLSALTLIKLILWFGPSRRASYLMAAVVFAGFVAVMFLESPLETYIKQRSPKRRLEMKSSIANLEEQLSKRFSSDRQ
jgi:hypothetical protein